MTEPNLPNPSRPKRGFNVIAPHQRATIMLIDRVTGTITTFEVVNQVTRFAPEDEVDVKIQIQAGRLCGALVVERTRTNGEWLGAIDASDKGE